MSDFRYKGYNFNLTSFREFVNEFNIFNNQRASAENLNKAVNKLWLNNKMQSICSHQKK